MNYSYLLPYVSHWRNLHLYCMTEAEVKKISSSPAGLLFMLIMLPVCVRQELEPYQDYLGMLTIHLATGLTAAGFFFNDTVCSAQVVKPFQSC